MACCLMTPSHYLFQYWLIIKGAAFTWKNLITGAHELNTLTLRRNGQHLADDIFKCIFFNENVWISLKSSLNFFPKVLINNIPALVQIMAQHLPGDKPLPEPMMVSLLTRICVTWPQWVNPHNMSPEITHLKSYLPVANQLIYWHNNPGTLQIFKIILSYFPPW